MSASIACASCGKSYTLKPEYIGKKLKCKCGATISVPAEEPDTFDIADEPPAKPVAKPPTRPAAVAAASAPLPRGALPPRRVTAPSKNYGRGSDTGERSALGKVVGGILTVLVLISIGFKILRIFVFSRSSASAQPISAPANSSTHDEDALALMAKDQMVPMSAWLTSGPNGKMLGGYSLKQAQYLYNDKWKKELGVTEVYIANAVMSLVVVFELPTNPAARSAIYAWQAKWHEQQQLPIVKDTGGKFLMISIPLVKPD